MMGIFTPAWEHKEIEKALDWVRKQKENAPVLMKVARSASRDYVAEEAARKITDEHMLDALVREIGMRGKPYIKNVQYRAINRIRDQKLLRELLRDGYLHELVSYRSGVFSFGPYENLTDHDTLLDILTDPAFFRRQDNPRAIERAKLDAFTILEKTEKPETMIGLLKTLPTDRSLLHIRAYVDRHYISFEQVVFDEAYPVSVRLQAAKEISDPSLHIRLALNQSIPAKERAEMVEVITDQEVLKTILATETDEDMLLQARLRITDPEMRKSFCENTDSDNPLHGWQILKETEGSHFDKDSRYYRDVIQHRRCVFCGLEYDRKTSYWEQYPNDDNDY